MKEHADDEKVKSRTKLLVDQLINEETIEENEEMYKTNFY